MNAKNVKQKSSKPKLAKIVDDERILTQKWGANVIESGYTVIPSIVLRAQRRLHLDSTQMVVLFHLLDFWWKPGDMPWPSKAKIAKRMGVSEKTVQRAMSAMEEEGLLTRKTRYHSHGGRTSNIYDLKRLVERLKKLAGDLREAEDEATEIVESSLKPSLKTKLKNKNPSHP